MIAILQCERTGEARSQASPSFLEPGSRPASGCLALGELPNAILCDGGMSTAWHGATGDQFAGTHGMILNRFRSNRPGHAPINKGFQQPGLIVL